MHRVDHAETKRSQADVRILSRHLCQASIAHNIGGQYCEHPRRDGGAAATSIPGWFTF